MLFGNIRVIAIKKNKILVGGVLDHILDVKDMP